MKSSVILRFFLALLLAMPLCTQAQTYGNEWIDFSKTYYKIKVARDGIYRIPYSVLSAANIPVTSVAGSQFTLFCKGEVVPIYVSTTGLMGNNDYIEFIGKKNDGSVDLQMFEDPYLQANPTYSLVTDTIAYFLAWNTIQPGKFFSAIPNDLNNLPNKEVYCTTTITQSTNGTYNQGKPAVLAGVSLYESMFDDAEGYGDATFNLATKSYTFATPSLLASSALTFSLKLNVVSTSISDHQLRISFNALPVLIDTSYYGYRLNKWEWINTSNNLNANNTLNISAIGPGSIDRNQVMYLSLTYPHNFNTNGATKFEFNLNTNSGVKFLEFTSFSSANTTPILYDLTNQIRIEGQNNSGTQQFKIPTHGGAAERIFYLSNTSGTELYSVTTLARTNFINYNNPSNQGSYIIISSNSLTNDGNGNNWVNEYARYRASAAGGGYSVATILVEQLYDQFAYGIAKHPSAIRNFMHFTDVNWIDKRPEYLFLIGKGFEYKNMRSSSGTFNDCLIPTWGYPGSDNLLAGAPGTLIPIVPVGRIAATTPAQVKDYLDKVKVFEAEQNLVGDPYQTIANKLWTKELLHLGGGNNSSEQATFKFYLESFEDIVRDTFYGGNVTSFFKNSSNPIQIAQSNFLSSRLNQGVSLLTFFGHSSPNSFDFTIDDPNNYNNSPRFPFILSNGCYSGNIFNPDPGISENFIFAQNKGAIAFLATTALSSSNGLSTYSRNFYFNLSPQHYLSTVGELMKKTIEDIEICCNSSFNRMVAQDLILHGDPALKINPHAKPDYALEAQNVFFDPPIVTLQTDSFDLYVAIANLGMAIDTQINLEVIRTLPDGTSFTYNKVVDGTHYLDTFKLTLPTGSGEAFGLNNLQVTIDAGDKVPLELSETNNTLGITFSILSEDVYPIHPYEFAIVPNQGVILKASTANAFALQKTYIMEIDTTELFNSPVKRSTSLVQTGGVLSWAPGVIMTDSTVYYWRVGIDSTGAGTPYRWRNSSFIYIQDEFPGWNQSHYYQYLKDEYQNLELPANRQFKFADDVKTISVRTGTWDGQGGAVPFDQMAYFINNVKKQDWNCGGSGGFPAGVTIAVIDPSTGNNWVSRYADVVTDAQSGYKINSIHKSIHCKTIDVGGFMFPVNTAYWQQRIVDFVNSIPNGYYVLVYSVNFANYAGWGAPLQQTFTDLGSTAIPQLVNQSGSSPWIMFTTKGNPSVAQEVSGNSINDILNFNTSVTASWYEGQMTTPLIGPAFEWGSVHWRWSSLDSLPNDIASIDVIGVNNAGIETVLIPNLTNLDEPLTNINAAQYPYLKLKLTTRDDSTRTPIQLDYWRVLYKKVPEAALNAFQLYQFTDSITLGDNLKLDIAVENVSPVDMDSLLVKYSILTSNRAEYTEYIRYDSLKAFQSANLTYQFNSSCNCLDDVNTLIIEINPDDDQPEQFHFNNLGILQFRQQGDIANPLLDVTFDNVHIINGDIVSAEPEILIKLKDENRFLALNDTSLLNVFLKYPDGQLIRQNFTDPRVQFRPATTSQANNKNNLAEVQLNKTFEQDGTYELLVQAQDRSANVSGTYGVAGDGIDYRLSFEIINKSMISNVLNYPNPFTTQTRFVFTLTGSQVPTFFKIQIMTVSGKVVREIMLDELGPIRIGRNITEFAWNGTDQYGDPLGNGLYLYRIVASIDGQSIEKMGTGADKYFKSGFGKMYLAR
jgi:flagellar hook assembly protein FlgD